MAKTWTEEDEQYIKDNFLDTTYGDLAEHFDVSTKAMESKIRRMGLKKQEILSEQAEQEDEPPEPIEPPKIEEPAPTPIGSIQSIERKSGIVEETAEERAERIEAELEAAEEQKSERQEIREGDDVGKALSKLEDGLELMMNGDYKKASSAFEKLIDSSPDAAITARARQFLMSCEQQLAKAPAKPETADDFYLHGVVRMNEGALDEALESFDKAADKAPDDDKITYCQAATHALRGDVEAALEALAKAIDQNDANRVYAKNDSDFTPLRVHEEFQELVAAPEEADEAS